MLVKDPLEVIKLAEHGPDGKWAVMGSLCGLFYAEDDAVKRKSIPGIVFARGPAVAVSILLESIGHTYAVLTEQARVRIGSLYWSYQLECWMMKMATLLAPQSERGHADEDTIMALQRKETGLRDHGELIKLRVVPYDQLWRSTADAKALSAVALYEMAKKEGVLPLSPPSSGTSLNL